MLKILFFTLSLSASGCRQGQEATSVFLNDSPLNYYTSDISLTALPFGTRNVSGQTMLPATGNFLFIRNNDKKLHESTSSFSAVREIEITIASASKDLEDIVYLGTNGSTHDYALINEVGEVLVGAIPNDSSTTLDMNSFQKITYIDPTTISDNLGGEGLAYDSTNRRFYACHEKNNMIIYQFDRPSTTNDISYLTGLTVTTHAVSDILSHEVSDLSSCLFDPRTGRLILLSHESQKIVDFDLSDYSIKGTLTIDGALSQYEGITLNGDYDLILTSEPAKYRTYSYNYPARGTTSSR